MVIILKTKLIFWMHTVCVARLNLLQIKCLTRAPSCGNPLLLQRWFQRQKGNLKLFFEWIFTLNYKIIFSLVGEIVLYIHGNSKSTLFSVIKHWIRGQELNYNEERSKTNVRLRCTHMERCVVVEVVLTDGWGCRMTVQRHSVLTRHVTRVLTTCRHAKGFTQSLEFNVE